MASSSLHVPQTKHDVFISFRGADTRRGFVSHLNEALCQKKIDVFLDDKLERGDEISPALFEAIERSQISLIVFSKEYAFSSWCLDELVKIMECLETNGQVVIPVFYDIDPSDVRNLKGTYGDAFDKYGEVIPVFYDIDPSDVRNLKGTYGDASAEYGAVFEHNMGKVHNWSIALKRAANLSGYHSVNFGSEAKLIKQIVERVLKTLKYIYMDPNDREGLVGIHKEIAFLESLVVRESEAVRIIGIWGMGGIGKTTIAKELYDRLHFEYEAACFVENVREKLEKYEVTHLQNEIVCKLLGEKDQSIGTPTARCEYMTRLHRRKVLLVLDDVNDLRKLRNLYGGHGWFGQGSRVIVTSRDKQVLTNAVDDIYEVKRLRVKDSLQLFCLNAFKENDPKLELRDLSMRAVEYAGGIPLAIEVLGSSLHGKEKKVWKSELEKLKKVPLPEIQNVLRLSYDGLDREDQDIFLFLACFFNNCINWHYHYMPLLDNCGYSTEAGLTNLENKSLLRCWIMHNLISDMGKEIVCGESRDPGKRRHLWDANDIYQVLGNGTGTKAIESIRLYVSNERKELHLSPKAFSQMLNLKFLDIDGGNLMKSKRKIFAPTDLDSMPDGLRLLSWKGYPLKSLPSAFCAENLVLLDLSYSCLERLWDGVQKLVKLKEIHLCWCEQLMELPDLSMALNLKVIALTHCTSLSDLHPSILSLHKLKHLALNGCKNLKEFLVISESKDVNILKECLLHEAKEGKGLCMDDKVQKKFALKWWLESIDPHHRDGHNLHFYYVIWFHSQSSQPFFYWLDVGDGKEVNIRKCPRSELQRQCIKYLGPKAREAYEVTVEGGRFIYRKSQDLVHTAEGSKWIFVLSSFRILYVWEKQKGQFQHSTFVAGDAIIACGRLVAQHGVLEFIWPCSGHYCPTAKNFMEFIGFLEERNVDLTNVKLQQRYAIDDDVPPSKPVDDEVQF